jgi:uncharacterized tellurite resistance protein B-like protein
MSTQFISKMNQKEAGFHLLVLLSLADGNSSSAETDVILEFLDQAFPGSIDLIKEQAFVKVLPEEERENHFREIAARFLAISDSEERTLLIEFAMKLVMADARMDQAENSYINLLYDLWDMA